MKSIGIIIVAVLQTGCVTFMNPAGIEPNINPMENMPYKVVGEIETKTSNFDLFFLFNVTPKADFNRAILESVQSLNGDALIDVRWWEETQHWIFGTISIIHIKGKVIKYQYEAEGIE